MCAYMRYFGHDADADADDHDDDDDDDDGDRVIGCGLTHHRFLSYPLVGMYATPDWMIEWLNDWMIEWLTDWLMD